MRYLTTLLFVCLSCTSLFGGSMSVTEGIYTPFSTKVINDQVKELAEDINDEKIIKLSGNQEEMTQAINYSNSALFLQGAHYSGFTAPHAYLSIGTGLAAENAPGLVNLPSDLEDGKDTASGATLGGITGSLTFRGDVLPFIPNGNLLFNIRGGGFSLENIQGYDLTYNSFLLGGGVRYKFFNFERNDSHFQLRDISVGLGVHYVSTETVYVPDDINKTSDESNGFYTKANTDLEFVISSSTYSFPIDVVVATNVFSFLNLFAGTGFDLAIGYTRVDVDSDTTITAFDENDNVIPSDNPAKMKLEDSETEVNSPAFRYKIIAGLGINVEPVRIDIPIVYYPVGGTSVSMLVGASF